MIHMSWQNVLDNNGLAICITGMSIVFSGLVLISLFIFLLPRMLALFDKLRALRLRAEDPAVEAMIETPLPGEPSAEEVATAIGLVIHMELERLTGESQKITIARRPAPASIWASAGKMRTLSPRSIHA